MARNTSELPGRVVGSLILFALGAWPILTQEARFRLGGRRGHGAIDVNAAGIDAIAIGGVAVALGLVNLALGMRGPARLRVFWAGAILFLVVLSFGAYRAVQALTGLGS